jgi:hypothetical protein
MANITGVKGFGVNAQDARQANLATADLKIQAGFSMQA